MLMPLSSMVVCAGNVLIGGSKLRSRTWGLTIHGRSPLDNILTLTGQSCNNDRTAIQLWLAENSHYSNAPALLFSLE